VRAGRGFRSAPVYCVVLGREQLLRQVRARQQSRRRSPSSSPSPGLRHRVCLRAAAKTLCFCYDRLSSLMKTLEVTDMDDFTPIHLVADFATLVGTYAKGFAVRLYI